MVLYYFRRDKYNDVQTEGRFASLNITTGDEIENLANSMTEMDKHGLAIGAMGGMKYKEYEIQMKPGAKLFVYTDGVAEATNAQNELFGMSRTVDAPNQAADKSPEEILQTVNSAVESFVGEAEQFDDLTMMCIEFRGQAQ